MSSTRLTFCRKGNATSEDVKTLISVICSTVFDKFGVMLETEIKFF